MADKNDNGMSPLVAGAVGIGVGVAVGAAAAILSDENKRNELKDAATDLKDKAVDTFHNAEDAALKAGEDVKAKAAKKFNGTTKTK